jgi:hypothetical protein
MTPTPASRTSPSVAVAVRAPAVGLDRPGLGVDVASGDDAAQFDAGGRGDLGVTAAADGRNGGRVEQAGDEGAVQHDGLDGGVETVPEAVSVAVSVSVAVAVSVAITAAAAFAAREEAGVAIGGLRQRQRILGFLGRTQPRPREDAADVVDPQVASCGRTVQEKVG